MRNDGENRFSLEEGCMAGHARRQHLHDGNGDQNVVDSTMLRVTVWHVRCKRVLRKKSWKLSREGGEISS